MEVPAPEKNLKLAQISVGLNSVWAITDDDRVWFRQGIRADRNHASEELLKGSRWIEMVGRMNSVSVSAHDQVLTSNFVKISSFQFFTPSIIFKGICREQERQTYLLPQWNR